MIRLLAMLCGCIGFTLLVGAGIWAINKGESEMTAGIDFALAGLGLFLALLGLIDSKNQKDDDTE